MKVLVVGSGGREHAIVWKLRQSARIEKVYCTPGNAGIGEEAKLLSCGLEMLDCIEQSVVENQIDLVVIGPEVVLAAGLTDRLQAKGVRVYGPTQAAARLESSKRFAKEFMQKFSIPTARFATFTDDSEAKAYIDSVNFEVVVKADGLAAGKGVVVPQSRQEAKEAVEQMMQDKVFGEAGAEIVIEEKLIGEEATLLCFCDGKSLIPMVPSQDHKRAYDNDEGPNTGGMGVYAPAPLITPIVMQRIEQEVLQPTLAGLQVEGIDYRGVLYVGLMIVDGAPYVIEYNARFGDPETQVVLPLLENDLLEIIEATEAQRLGEIAIKWKQQSACCVVLASGGYPGKYTTGYPISGLEAVGEATVFHAGTREKGGQIVSDGGRVLGVTALGATLEEAIEKSYAAVKMIHFEGVHYREDIGKKGVGSK